MIYSDKHRYLYLHIPRTGGSTITEAIAKADQTAVADIYDGKHRSYRELTKKRWDNYTIVATMRDPIEIVTSMYCHTVTSARKVWEQDWRACARAWLVDMAYTAAHSFEHYVERWLRLAPNGIWNRYAGDSVTMVPFGNEMVEQVGQTIGLELTRRPKTNASDHSAWQQWRQDLRDRAVEVWESDYQLLSGTDLRFA